MACLACALLTNTFAPQSSYLTQIYDIPLIMVTMTSIINLISNPFITFPANYIIDKYGIRVGIILASIFCIIGSWVRCLINLPGGFWFAILGQFLAGVANPLIMNSLNKVSANWFYPKDRAGVTVFLCFFNSITQLIGLVMPGIMFERYSTDNLEGQALQKKLQERRDLQFNLILYQGIIVTFIMLPIIFLFKNNPPTPSSFTSQVEKEDFKVALRFISTNKNYLFQCLSFSLCYFALTTLPLTLNILIKPFGLGNPIYTSALSIMPIPGGVIGCVLMSIYLKRNQKYKSIILICIIGGGLSLVLFGTSLWTNNLYVVMSTTFLFGFFMVPCIPTMLEFACENYFPIGEGSISGFMYALAHTIGGLGGIGITYHLGTLPPNPLDEQIQQAQLKSMWTLAIMVLGFILAIIFNLFTKEILNRLLAEQSKKVKNIFEQQGEQSKSME